MKLEIVPFERVGNIFLGESREDIISKLKKYKLHNIGRDEVSLSNEKTGIHFRIAFDKNDKCNLITVFENEITINNQILDFNLEKAFEQISSFESEGKIFNDLDSKSGEFRNIGLCLYTGIEDCIEDEEGNEKMIYYKNWECIYVVGKENQEFWKAIDQMREMLKNID